jgi:hypothetical protein
MEQGGASFEGATQRVGRVQVAFDDLEIHAGKIAAVARRPRQSAHPVPGGDQGTRD